MHEINKVFKGCVKVCFFLKRNDIIKMSMIYVSVHTEKALQNSFSNGDEIAGERHTCQNTIDMINTTCK